MGSSSPQTILWADYLNKVSKPAHEQSCTQTVQAMQVSGGKEDSQWELGMLQISGQRRVFQTFYVARSRNSFGNMWVSSCVQQLYMPNTLAAGKENRGQTGAQRRHHALDVDR